MDKRNRRTRYRHTDARRNSRTISFFVRRRLDRRKARPAERVKLLLPDHLNLLPFCSARTRHARSFRRVGSSYRYCRTRSIYRPIDLFRATTTLHPRLVSERRVRFAREIGHDDEKNGRHVTLDSDETNGWSRVYELEKWRGNCSVCRRADPSRAISRTDTQWNDEVSATSSRIDDENRNRAAPMRRGKRAYTWREVWLAGKRKTGGGPRGCSGGVYMRGGRGDG